MRILHTGDLHIGKTVNNFNMLEDQKYVLTQMVELVKEKNAQVFIIAGDVYDRAIPTAEAVSVFDDFIEKLHETGVTILCISGNHDSADRLPFAGRITRVQISPRRASAKATISFKYRSEKSIYLTFNVFSTLNPVSP